MAFKLRSGTSGMPQAGDTIRVYETGTATLVTGLTTGGAAPQALANPFVVPASGEFWGFEPPTDAHVDIYWDEGTRNLIADVNIRDGNIDLNSHINDHPIPTNRDTRNEVANANIQSHISSTLNPHGVTAAQAGAEPAFTKNTAFNKDFGALVDTVTQGNDARLSDARTPTTHDLAGSEHSPSTLAALNLKVSDATLIDTADARLSNDRVPLVHGSDKHSVDYEPANANIQTHLDATVEAKHTKAQVELANVDNTSDADKPISTAQAAGLVGKTSNTGAAHIPAGTTAERPLTPTAGMFRLNTEANQTEFYDPSSESWITFDGAVDSRAIVFAIALGG